MGCYLQWSCGGAGRRLDFICFALTFCDRQQVVRTCGVHGQGLNSDITCAQRELQVSSKLPAKNKTIKSETHIHLARVILSLGLAPGHLEVANGSIYTYVYVCVCMYAVTVVRRHPRRKPSQADSLEFLTTACLNLLGLSQTLAPHTCPFHEDFSVAVACSRLHSSFSLPSLITITLVCASGAESTATCTVGCSVIH